MFQESLNKVYSIRKKNYRPVVSLWAVKYFLLNYDFIKTSCSGIIDTSLIVCPDAQTGTTEIAVLYTVSYLQIC